MHTIQEYYEILGVNESTEINEIKRAYRNKTKILHPDINKNINAHEEFITLTEAYKYLIAVKSGQIKLDNSYNETNDVYNYEKAREEATRYANMQYREFKNTDEYKNSEASVVITDHIIFALRLLLILAPLIGYITYSGAGLLLGLLFTFFTIQFWFDIFRDKVNLNLKQFLLSAMRIIKTRTVIYTVIIITNLFLFFRYTLNTQISILFIFTSLVIVNIIIFLFSKLINLKFHSSLLTILCIAISIFNLFFYINYAFSSNQTKEKYSFIHIKQWYGGYPSHWRFGTPSRAHLEKSAYIYLDNNKYSENYWFRTFFNFESMENKSEITYTFEKGIFNFRVLKSYQFTK